MAGRYPVCTCQPTCAGWSARLEKPSMADELKDLRVPVMMAATEVAAIDDWRRKQEDLPKSLRGNSAAGGVGDEGVKMNVDGLRELDEMAAKLKATAQRLPQG